MTSVPPPALFNRLLMRLSDDDLAALTPLLEPVDCARAMVLVAQDTAIEHTYFLDSGVASIVPVARDGQRVEGGVVGREGYITPATVLGATIIPCRIEMQIAGAGHRIGCRDLLATLDAHPRLRDVLHRFAQALMVQMIFSVAANALYNVEGRLARWLLMCHDRSDSDDLALTHALMGDMLAVRRSSVTTALHVLEGNRLIRADRGYVTIQDRAGLAAIAGDAYGKPEADYQRLLGPM